MVRPAERIRLMRRSGIREIMDLAAGRPDMLHLEVGQPDFPTPAAHRRGGLRGRALGLHDLYREQGSRRGAGEHRGEAEDGERHRRRGRRHRDHRRGGQRPGRDAGDAGVTRRPDPDPRPGVAELPDDGRRALRPGGPVPAAAGRGLPAGPGPAGRARARVRRDRADDQQSREPHRGRLPAGGDGAPGRPGARHDMYLLSDECYEQVVFEGEHVSPASLGAPDHVLSVFSMSKSYAMTGWRMGYVTGPRRRHRPRREGPGAHDQLRDRDRAEGGSGGPRRPPGLRPGDDPVLPRPAGHGRGDPAGGRPTRLRAARRLLHHGRRVGRRPGLVRLRPAPHHRGGGRRRAGETFGPSGAGTVRLSLATATADLREGTERLVRAVSSWGRS